MLDTIPDFEANQAEECGAFIGDALKALGYSPEIARELQTAVMEAHEVQYVRIPPHADQMLFALHLQTGWAIRSSDLEFFRTLLNSGAFSTAMAVALSSTTSPLAPIVAGFLGTAYTLYFRARKKAALLDPIKIAVLVALKKINNGTGATVGEIEGYLAELGLVETEVWATLRELSAVTLLDGSTAPFAFQDERSDRWHTDC